MIVRYFLAGKCILEELVSAEAAIPRRGDERGLDGKVYEVARVVRHMKDCPPDHVHVHLNLAGAEHLWPVGHP